MLKSKILMLCFVTLITFFPLTGIMATAMASDAETLERLEKIIKQQQTQIEVLQKQMSEIKAQSMDTGSMAKSPSGLVISGKKNTSVTLYGQVNRGVMVVDDGDKTNIYQVDNDNSSTRIGILGSAKPTDGLEIGTKIEVQFESNSTADVDRNNRRGQGSNNFTKRHLDLFLKSNPFGKFSLGFGSTASDSTSETDLSGTTVIGYSAVADMAGGQLFYNKTTNALTTTTVGSAFSNMDGLGRDDRIRYDSPAFYGFSAASSYIADGGGDIALRYGTKFNQFKMAAAAAYANHGSTSTKIQYQLSSSFSVLHDSGVSLSASAGSREYKNDTNGDGLFYYAKLGYQMNYFSIGKTAFAIDYGNYEDVAQVNDEATTFGAQFVQNLKEWNTEYYIGLRQYSLDRDSTDYEDINALLSGFRVKF